MVSAILFNGIVPDRHLESTIMAKHPKHHVRQFRSWKVVEGAHISNANNWIVDHDGHNHVTIAAKRDMLMPADYYFDRYLPGERNILMDKLDSDFPWVRDETSYVVLIPKIAENYDFIPPAAAKVLDVMLQDGDTSDICSVLALLPEALNALAPSATTASDLPPQWLQLALRTIKDFEASGDYIDEDYFPDQQLALKSLKQLTIDCRGKHALFEYLLSFNFSNRRR